MYLYWNKNCSLFLLHSNSTGCPCNPTNNPCLLAATFLCGLWSCDLLWPMRCQQMYHRPKLAKGLCHEANPLGMLLPPWGVASLRMKHAMGREAQWCSPLQTLQLHAASRETQGSPRPPRMPTHTIVLKDNKSLLFRCSLLCSNR